MSEEARIEVAILERMVYVRPHGYATQANSLGLPDFLSAMFQQGCTSVTFDLGECDGMDSTFLGVIAGAAMPRQRARGKTVAIVNGSESSRQQLAFIGLKPIIAIVEGDVELPDGLRFAQMGPIHWPKTERERVLKIKKLHENLVSLNDRNKDRFGDLIEMLDAELQGEEGG